MMRMFRRFLLLSFILLTVACSRRTQTQPPLAVGCQTEPGVAILEDGWQFAVDPDNQGLDGRWYASGHERVGWEARKIGQPWEKSGLDYNGLAWYARQLSWEGPEAYLFLADADDSATVWVDGVEAAQLNAQSPMTVLQLDNPSASALVVIRVLDNGGFGGLKSAPRLAESLEAALDEARLITYLEEQNPQLPPAPSGAAWTMIGGVDEAEEVLIAVDGSLSPYALAPSVQVWLRNSATGEIINPFAGGQFSLVDNRPIMQINGRAGDGISTSMIAYYDEIDQALRWRLDLNRDAGAPFAYDELLLAARPFRVNRTLASFCNPHLVNEDQLWLNDAPFLAAAREPDGFENGRSWAGLTYKLDDAPLTLDFSLPGAAGRDLPPAADFNRRLAETREAWAERANRAAITVPDGSVQAALEASLGYLLLASDPDGPHPGPLAHNAVWTRDAAYMGLALLMRGHEDVVRNYVTAVFGGQDADGRIPPIQGEAVPWDNNEWDAQGQAIFLAMQLYRYTGDQEYLEALYPQIALAADYIITLREQTAGDDDATRGLLPISLSAEDLADGEQHYYWDNFWAIVGLQQAADAADVLGEQGGARWRSEALSLRGAIARSLAEVMGNPPEYIPASVETLDNSGMARGTTPALHPVPIVPVNDPIIRRAFDTYAERWISPSGGGYMHREGQFWTYGGVELANAYLRLGRGDMVHQILGWTLNHQTLPGVFAWAEQVDPLDYTFSGGDMPHAWMASSYTILIRNMLVLEQARGPQDDSLTLFQTAPEWWFEDDRQIQVANLPTQYGELDLQTSGDLRLDDGKWQGTLVLRIDGAEPPGGYRWQIPQSPSGLNSDNKATLDRDLLWMPGPGTVTLTFD